MGLERIIFKIDHEILTNPMKDAKYRITAIHVNSEEVTMLNLLSNLTFKTSFKNLVEGYCVMSTGEYIKDTMPGLLYG